MSDKKLLLPLDYRADLLEKVTANLRMGECCSLVGTSGTGKSNLAQFLQKQDVQKIYWLEEEVWVLVLDAQSIVLEEEQAEQNVLETIVQYLVDEAERRPSAVEFLPQIQQIHRQLLTTFTYTNLMRAFQQLCQLLCTERGISLILVWDQFDNLWQSLPTRFFLYLRHIRDRFKYQVVYLVMTRDRLPNLRVDFRAVEPFWELFSAHTYGLSPCNMHDALGMVERLSIRTGSSVSKKTVERLIELSGRHPAILRAMFWVGLDTQWKNDTPEQWLQSTPVYEECQKIWDILSPIEQQIVQLLAQQVPPPESGATLVDLRLKGIVYTDPLRLFSPVFAQYIMRHAEQIAAGVKVDTRTRRIWLDGRLLDPPLSSLEFRLVEYLAKYEGEICEVSELMQDLYNDEGYTKNDQRLYALLTRVRRAFGETAQQPRYLIKHHGGGIQLLHARLIH